MARSLKSIIETKKNRLRRRSGKIFGEIVKAVTLTVAIGGLAFIMVYIYNFVITTSYFQLKDISVRGTEMIVRKEVLNLAGIGSHDNTLILNLKEISQKVETNPWIKSVSIGRELPDRLVIEVTERYPAALVLVDGSFYIMDRDGYIFKRYEKGDGVHLPVLNGSCKNGTINRDLIKKAAILLSFISSSRNFPRMEHISEIYGDNTYGFSLFTRGGLCLHLGFGNYGGKLERLRPVLTDLTRKNLNNVYLSIDLSDSNKVVVKRNNIFNQKRSSAGYSA